MNLLKKIFGSFSEASVTEVHSIHNEPPPTDPDTIVERYVQNFKQNGGKFIYCENLNEAKDQFLNILEENDWFECNVWCYEKNLYIILDENKLNYNNNQIPKFIFTSCENLITDDGSVLFSSTQIKHYKPNELPINMIVLATTKQIVENKSDGLRAIKNKYQTEYPTNITTIRYFEEHQEQNFLSCEMSAKNLYLLLVED